jgi:hypothetical protein
MLHSLLVVGLCFVLPFPFLIQQALAANVSQGHSKPNAPMKLWSSDFHISPIFDIKNLLAAVDVTVIDKSLSGHCHLTNTCQHDLRILTRQNGVHLSPCRNSIRRDFYNSYRCDASFTSVDAVVFTYALALAEAFMPFNKPMIIIANTRYEAGRYTSAEMWSMWNHNLVQIASKPGNFVGANNHYDLEYVKYFTGIKNVRYIPSYCGYVNTHYNVSRKEIILAPKREINEELANTVLGMAKDRNVNIVKMGSIYSKYEYSDLAKHPCFVILPYQLSFMTFFELYRMSIPLFLPSAELLTKWHMEKFVLKERSWHGAFSHARSKGSMLPRHPSSSSKMRSDPNDDNNVTAVLDWVRLGDYYIFPHVVLFDSFEHLFDLLQKTNLQAVSAAMTEFNKKQKVEIMDTWAEILDEVRAANAEKNSKTATCEKDFDTAMKEAYQVHLSGKCIGETFLR